jgi:hypothetical protein
MRRPSLSILAVALSTACGQGLDGPGLDELNQELANTTYTRAVEQHAYFAPLCDGRGYPLVGNIVSKGGTTASRFCEALRGLPRR